MEEIKSVHEDWDYLVRFLPTGWQEKSRELGALRRVRNFKDAESLLRSLLIHFVDGCSLRETAVRIREGGIANVSDVALLKRLNCSGEWLRWMACELMKNWKLKLPTDIFPKGYSFRIVDGTMVSEPGSTGSDWRIHYSINMLSLQCDEVKVTDTKTGESFKRFSVKRGDVFLGDRGYGHTRGVEHVVKKGGDVLVRINLTNLPLYDLDGSRFDLLKRLTGLHGTQVGDWPCHVRGEEQNITGRVCAIKKSKIATERAQQKVMSASRKEGHETQQETLMAAGYIFVFTTMEREVITASSVLEMYRGRWQIELAFKRLKSIMGLGHLPKQDPEGARAWIHGKVFASFLIETLIMAGELFFPWGYPLSEMA